MTSKINILWIKTQDNQLTITPRKGSVLHNIFPNNKQILSYDNQAQYPWTSEITVARELQSALKNEYVLQASLLNLSAVPRKQFQENNWQEKYLSQVIKNIPFGKSDIKVRRIGKDISKINNLSKIISRQDIILIPSSFETNINEQKRILKYIKSINPNKPVFATGTGTEGYEEELLNEGFDLIFQGTISDRGDEVLKSYLEQDFSQLSLIPGVFSNVTKKPIRNLGARNFRHKKEIRHKNIQEWRNRLPKYQSFVPVNVQMIGRPDLSINEINDLISPYNVFQDLDIKSVEQISNREVFFAADNIVPQIDCPRECNFCVDSGRGSAIRDVKYSMQLIEYYSSIGATDIIPTTDQVLLSALNINHAKNLIKIFDLAKDNQIKFYYGDGLETWALHQIINKSKPNTSEGKTYKNLLDSMILTTGYFYLPYENIWGLKKGKKFPLNKLRSGLDTFVETLDFLNTSAKRTKNQFEVGTNIILNINATKNEAIDYYKTMDNLTKQYSHLRFRYNTFFMIPSNCAPHITQLQSSYKLYSTKFPELKVVSIPQILLLDETPTNLEQKLLWNYEALIKSNSCRKLQGGTYR